jgi:hypothetical protein
MMDDMKNLLIQALETRGVLGQIRAKLRSSVFKIVDDQDQKFNMGCGLKWENPTLYKITDTKIGQLSAELIREFMEYLKMDYSLSVFIPECSISPERIRKEEIFGKLGIKPNSELNESPTLYFIIYYFLFSVITEPNKVIEFMNSVKKEDVEDQTEKIINENQKNFYNENNMEDGGEQIMEDGFVEQNLEYELNNNNNINNHPQESRNYHNIDNSNNNQANRSAENDQAKIKENSSNVKSIENNIKHNNDYNSRENNIHLGSNSNDLLNNISSNINNNQYNENDDKGGDDILDEEIEELICEADDSYDKSKKVSLL